MNKAALLMSGTRRLFFALWPSAMLRAQLVERRQSLVDESAQPVHANNLHVTLAFIGSVDAAHLQTLVAVGRRSRLSACELVFDRFAVWRQAGVLVLEAAATPPLLQQLVMDLHGYLTIAGFGLDTRPYRPHVTLARKVRTPCEGQIAPLRWPARDFVLVESVATTAGVQYRVLATFAS